MKNLQAIVIVFCIGLIPFFSAAQTLEEVIEKYANATGGRENWNKIKSIKIESTMKVQGMEIQMNQYQVNCKASRQEIIAMGMKGYSIATDTAGWNFMPFQGQTKPEPFTPDQLKLQKDELCITEKLLTYKEFGYKAEYLGTEDVEGVSCHKIKIIKDEDTERTYYIDPENFLLIKQVSKMKLNGQVMENQAVFGNYQKIDAGVLIPFTTTAGGAEITIIKVTTNENLDPSLFVPGN
jgi:hypothetical protein